eukprot:1161427-Pelagomonas_calceolata.AAC.5
MVPCPFNSKLPIASPHPHQPQHSALLILVTAASLTSCSPHTHRHGALLDHVATVFHKPSSRPT